MDCGLRFQGPCHIRFFLSATLKLRISISDVWRLEMMHFNPALVNYLLYSWNVFFGLLTTYLRQFREADLKTLVRIIFIYHVGQELNGLYAPGGYKALVIFVSTSFRTSSGTGFAITGDMILIKSRDHYVSPITYLEKEDSTYSHRIVRIKCLSSSVNLA